MDVLFRTHEGPGLARRILRIFGVNPEVTIIELNDYSWDLDSRASTRLGFYLGRNTHVKELNIISNNPDLIGLCAGLQNNQCIQSLNLIGINFQHDDKMNALVPFLSNNSSLKLISLRNCNIGSAGINILSTALLNRSEDTLECLNLENNHFGDIDLDQLVLALNRNRMLTTLLLWDTGIGLRGCISLAKLLSNRESNLQYLYLDGNSIDNETTIILADSLAKNTKLQKLDLYGNNAITAKGWSAMLELLCNSSSINAIKKSNHTLCSIGYLTADFKMRIEHSLGTNDANLLHASLKLNIERNKTLVVRRKILWSHARGDLNLGDSSIAVGAMPCILAWICDDSNESNAILIQHHEPPRPKAKIGAIRLDSIYRILLSKPHIVPNGYSNKRMHSNNRGMWVVGLVVAWKLMWGFLGERRQPQGNATRHDQF